MFCQLGACMEESLSWVGAQLFRQRSQLIHCIHVETDWPDAHVKTERARSVSRRRADRRTVEHLPQQEVGNLAVGGPAGRDEIVSAIVGWPKGNAVMPSKSGTGHEMFVERERAVR